MPAEAYHDFPLSDNWEWDASVEVPKLRQWASSDGSGDKDKIDWGKLRKVYFWHEAGELSDFGQLKFPYCRIENDSPHVVHNAVQNALARIDGSNIPEEDKPAVRRVAQRQMDRFQEDEDGDSRAHSGTAQAASRTYGKPTPSQLEKVNALAKRPLSADEVFVFSTKMVGDALIKHPWPISLHRSLLETFKQDALTGVAFMLDHPWAGFFGRPKPAYAYGRTFDARLKKGEIEGENWALYGDVYIVRGKEKDGVSTDAIIRDIEDGTLFDVSIGFGNERDECSICGNDIWDYEKCQHVPGREYDGQLCYIIAKPPGYLMELSGVFDGAYPSAEILSAAADRGVSGDLQLIEEFSKSGKPHAATYKVFSAARGRLLTFAKRESADRRIVVPGAKLEKGEGNVTEPKTYSQGEVDALVKAAVDKAVAEALRSVVPAQLDSTPEFLTKERATEVLGKELEADAVLRFAKDGMDYREELIQEAIDWGVRAQGNDFPVDSWRQLLGEPGRTIQAIKDFRDGFKKQAQAVIPAGRVTMPAAKDGARRELPDEAFEA